MTYGGAVGNNISKHLLFLRGRTVKGLDGWTKTAHATACALPYLRFFTTGTIRSSCATVDGGRHLGSPVEKMRIAPPLKGGSFDEVLWYFVPLRCNVRALQHLGRIQRRGSSLLLRGQRIRILCPILEVHDGVMYCRRKSGSVPASSSFLARVRRIRLAVIGSITTIEVVPTVPAT